MTAQQGRAGKGFWPGQGRAGGGSGWAAASVHDGLDSMSGCPGGAQGRLAASRGAQHARLHGVSARGRRLHLPPPLVSDRITPNQQPWVRGASGEQRRGCRQRLGAWRPDMRLGEWRTALGVQRERRLDRRRPAGRHGEPRAVMPASLEGGGAVSGRSWTRQAARQPRGGWQHEQWRRGRCPRRRRPAAVPGRSSATAALLSTADSAAVGSAARSHQQHSFGLGSARAMLLCGLPHADLRLLSPPPLPPRR